jgi:serine/threonine-protein kinase RsbW
VAQRRKVQSAKARRSEAPRLDRRRLSLRYRSRIPSTMQAINHAVGDVIKVAKKVGCVGDGRAEMEIALREALANAVIHGNKSAPEKSVLLRCYCDPDVGLLVAIRDEGSGFVPDEVPDPRSAERIELTHGRGLFLMRELMDHVEHRKGGREVVLYKKATAGAEKRRR